MREFFLGFKGKENIVIDFHKILKYAKIVICDRNEENGNGKIVCNRFDFRRLTTEKMQREKLKYMRERERDMRINGSMFARFHKIRSNTSASDSIYIFMR